MNAQFSLQFIVYSLQRGVSIIFAIFMLLLLSVVTLAVFSLVSTDIDTASSSIVSERALDIAEGGVQYGAMAVEEDVLATAQTSTPASNGYCALAFIEGGYNNNYSGASGSNNDRAAFHGTSWSDSTVYFCTLNNVNNAEVRLWNFQQAINLIGTRLKNLEIVIRGRKASGGGANPTIQLEYSTDGGSNWSSAGSVITFSSTSWPSGASNYSYGTVTLPSNPWQYFMNNNFVIRARRTAAGNRACNIDWLALRITYEVDAQTEPWFTTFMTAGNPPTPNTLNEELGKGVIYQVDLSDESGKVNLNYASQTLLEYLLGYNGVPTGLAEAIVNYRTGPPVNWLNTVEELKQVSGMTDTYYDAIDQDVTVFSWVNSEVERATGNRAPVNINTASSNVLKAVFRTAITDESDVSSLDTAVRSQRETTPFTEMFSTYYTQSATRDNKCLAGFLENQAYLSATQRNEIRGAADGSLYNSALTSDWTGSDTSGTELSYYTNTFLIASTGRIAQTDGNVDRQVASTYGHAYTYNTYSLDSSGTFKLPSYIGETPSAYWKEKGRE